MSAGGKAVKARLLVADDEDTQREILRLILEGEGYEVALAATGRQALKQALAQPFDLVLTDLKMPDLSGIELLEELLAADPRACVILMTAHGSIDSAVEAMRRGAFDYLTKPLERDELLLVLQRALECTELVRENRRLQEQLTERYRLENIVGGHGSMQEVFRIVHKVADSASSVLIHGESGTGKELVARAIHQLSGRRDKPFWAVNIAALPETILEAELFGHEKGAFTGADVRKVGLFEQAHGSTLFLDEVGDLRRDLQVKLLRALQEREILRVGGTERIKIDVRIVAATNLDLEKEVREGRFREDLYYRLSVIPVRLPPLRERRPDIPLLVEHFLDRLCRPDARKQVDPDALRALVAYDWPGNVRELQSVLERAVLLSDGDLLGPADLPASVRAGIAPVRRGSAQAIEGLEIPDEGIDLDAVERSLIRKAVVKAGGNVTRAARLLGLTRRTLQYRLEKLQAEPVRDGASD